MNEQCHQFQEPVRRRVGPDRYPCFTGGGRRPTTSAPDVPKWWACARRSEPVPPYKTQQLEP
jgi:hypothetical protein